MSLPAHADPGLGRRKGERGVWQRRFWEHLVRDSDDLERLVTYIHANPVKHGLVAEPDDWPYSSWHMWKRKIETMLGGTHRRLERCIRLRLDAPYNNDDGVSYAA